MSKSTVWGELGQSTVKNSLRDCQDKVRILRAAGYKVRTEIGYPLRRSSAFIAAITNPDMRKLFLTEADMAYFLWKIFIKHEGKEFVITPEGVQSVKRS